MGLFKRKHKIHPKVMEADLVMLMVRQAKAVDTSMMKLAAHYSASSAATLEQALHSTEPDCIRMLVRHTLHSFLYHEIEARYGYRAAGQITMKPLTTSVCDFSMEDGFSARTYEYYNTHLNDTYSRLAREDQKSHDPIESPAIRELFLSEFQRIVGATEDINAEPFFNEVQNSFKPVITYLNTHILVNHKGQSLLRAK